MINIENVINEKYPSLDNYPKLWVNILLKSMKNLFKENEINSFLEKNKASDGIDFIDKVLDYFQFSYKVSHHDKKHIPASGRVLIVANHPIGSLDGLALLRMISEIRPDIKIVANDMLASLAPLKPLMLPVDNLKSKTSVSNIKNLIKALNNEEAVIVFPAGEVSRLSPVGVRDGIWNDGFVRIAEKTQSPILPVHIKSRNSLLFYFTSLCNRRMSSLLLVNEMFNKVACEVVFSIDEAILPRKSSDQKKLCSESIRKKIYKLPKSKRKPAANKDNFAELIALPESRQLLNKELSQSQLLTKLRDGKSVFLFDYFENSAVMREIGRLRELTFRVVGEGVGISRDLDIYDHCFRHIVLWDDKDLEIVGAYRIGECKELIKSKGFEGIYSHTVFDFKDEFKPYAENAIELGRSFVQPKYWNTRSLDYLWHGIGAYLKHHPHIQYMFGPVSISNSYPEEARQKLVGFYQHFFGAQESLAKAKHSISFDQALLNDYGNDYKSAFKELKAELKLLGCTVPVLYKQYSDLCEKGGVQFLDFGIDPDFSNCTDGLILVEVSKMREKMVHRYINPPPLVA